MKKFLSFTMAITVLLSAVSCSKGNNKKPADKQSYTAEQLSVAAYKKESIPVPESMNMIYTTMVYNNGNDMLLLGSGKRTPEFWKVSGDFSESEIVEFEDFRIGVNYAINMADDGTLVSFLTHADYGDLPPIPLYEYPEEYEMEKYDKAAEYSFMIRTYSPDGKLSTSAEISTDDFGVEPSKNVNYGELYTDGKFLIVEINGSYEMFDFEGKYLGEFTTDSGDIDCIGQDNNGNIICALKQGKDDEEKLTFKKISSDGKLTDISNTEYDFTETVYEIQPTSGDYSLLLRTNTQIYGVKADTEEIVSLLDIRATGCSTNFIECFRIMPDGNMALAINDSAKWQVNIKKFIPRSEEEMANIKTITLGIHGDSIFVDEFVNEWNDAGNDFLVEIVSYDSDFENREATFDQMKQDAISGNLPDLMYFDHTNCVMGEVDFGKMGVLEDLYTYIDNDEVYNRDYYLPNVLNCLEYDGELLTMPNRFYISLGTVAKTKFVGDGSDWNLDKLVDLTINPPIEKYIQNDSKYTRLSMISWEEWIDYKNATCHFNDDSFIRFLKYCNEAEDINFQYEEKTEQEWQDYYQSEEARLEMYKEAMKYREDKEIFSTEGITTYAEYLDTAKGIFGGEPITILDDITLDGSDGIAITKTSENKDLAWEFIKFLISDQYYKDHINYAPFPVTKSGYEIFKAKYAYENPTYEGLEGFEDYVGHIYYAGDELIKIGNITEEDIATVEGYIQSAVNKRVITIPREQLYNIAYDDFDRFFNGGCTAEECASDLQNRLSIYISEHVN